MFLISLLTSLLSFDTIFSSEMSMALSNYCVASLRARVTDADVDYVGSITIDHRFCDSIGLLDRQVVQVRNERTCKFIETYVIYGRISDALPPRSVCINGAAAHFFRKGDIVSICSFGAIPINSIAPKARVLDTLDPLCDALIEDVSETTSNRSFENYSISIVTGKIHRARITGLRERSDATETQPILEVDDDWLLSADIHPNSVVHLLNIRTGNRDIITVKSATSKSKTCDIIGSENALTAFQRSYDVGDVVIIVRYCLVPKQEVISGVAPPLKIYFPFEAPIDL